jgi:3',5'-cyclic AMP phosphodiesterase CpdA
LAVLGLAGYSYTRGIRIPPLRWEPKPLATNFASGQVDIEVSELIQSATQVAEQVDYSFRAYAPEPALRITANNKSKLRISVNNVAQETRLNIVQGRPSSAIESIDGINRILELTLDSAEPLTIEWKLPSQTSYSFAAIGDTGGQSELAWCIQRAKSLSAQFLLHLGDFNYQSSDYANSIKLFNSAPLPVYVSIGNHDFHDSGPIYQQFLEDIGPFNNVFQIGKTRFANLDTAANHLPYGAGSRGHILQQMALQTDAVKHTVVFTHRPLYDPQPNSDHDIGSIGERDWLIGALKEAKVQSMLSGHIHIFHRKQFQGIDSIIVGQGLGHQDLLVNDIDYSKMAIGRVSKDGSVEYEFAPLRMPMGLHCHPRTDPVRQSLKGTEQDDLLDSINRQCKPQVT